MQNLTTANDLAEDLKSWYWAFGRLRDNPYMLPVDWLNTLYDTSADIASLTGLDARSRSSIAVWGPSQTGKSLLLSSFLDEQHGQGEEGEDPGTENLKIQTEDSALTWPGGPTYRFAQPFKRVSDVPILNPWNQGSDASGCVTRFVLRDEVDDPQYPVTVTLGGRQEVMHALASGYLQECKLATEDRDKTFWNADTAGALLGEEAAADKPLNREAFELARDAILTGDRMLVDDHERYHGLRRVWLEEVRPQFMRAAKDPQAMDMLMRSFLWDNVAGINLIYDELRQALNRFEPIFEGKRIICSLDVAALLLDIDSFRKSLNYPETKARVDSIRYQKQGDTVRIGHDGDKKLFDLDRDPNSFGLFQGLVWELEVPLKRSFVERQSPAAARLLEKADVIDVPGVARQHQAATAQQLDVDTDEVPTDDLLARVLKRGKTASIINRYARDRMIDNLLLLIRAADEVSSPRQLQAGVQAIWSQHGPGARQVPTFLGLTFMNLVINRIAANGGRLEDGGLTSLEGMLAKLGDAADPDRVTTFALTYPGLDEGKINANMAMRERIQTALEADEWVQSRFNSAKSLGSLNAVLTDPDGGVGYLIECLDTSIGVSPRAEIVPAGTVRAWESLEEGVLEALPRKDGTVEETRAALLRLMDAVMDRIQSGRSREGRDPCLKVSQDLRQVVGVDHHQLDLPPRSQTNEFEIRHYLERQVNAWAGRPEALAILGSYGLEGRQPALVLASLGAEIDLKAIGRWIFQFMPATLQTGERNHLRTYIATLMANCIVGGGIDGGEFWNEQSVATGQGDYNQVLDECQERFDRWSQVAEPTHSPHYDMIIAPLMNRFVEISGDLKVDTWKDQKGDKEILKIKERYTL